MRKQFPDLTRSLSLLIICTGTWATAPSALAQSCMVSEKAMPYLSQTKAVSKATKNHLVLRPCMGLVKGAQVDVTYSTNDGLIRDIGVKPGEYIDQRVAADLSSKKTLGDIWPQESLLAVLGSFLGGDRVAIKARSGFEPALKHLPLEGTLLMQADIRLKLSLFGLDAVAPVSLHQGGRKLPVSPQDGFIQFPMQQLTPGELELKQGGLSFKLILVPLSDEPELAEQLKAAGRESGLAMNRALMLQAAQYPLNAAAELMNQGDAP